jgi:hypothetical protein
MKAILNPIAINTSVTIKFSEPLVAELIIALLGRGDHSLLKVNSFAKVGHSWFACRALAES